MSTKSLLVFLLWRIIGKPVSLASSNWTLKNLYIHNNYFNNDLEKKKKKKKNFLKIKLLKNLKIIKKNKYLIFNIF